MDIQNREFLLEDINFDEYEVHLLAFFEDLGLEVDFFFPIFEWLIQLVS